MNGYSGLATMSAVNTSLAKDGLVRFVWKTAQPILVKANNETVLIDGRTYQAILRRTDLIQTETGDTTKGDLVIEWRKEQS